MLVLAWVFARLVVGVKLLAALRVSFWKALRSLWAKIWDDDDSLVLRVTVVRWLGKARLIRLFVMSVVM